MSLLLSMDTSLLPNCLSWQEDLETQKRKTASAIVTSGALTFMVETRLMVAVLILTLFVCRYLQRLSSPRPS